MSSEIDLKKQKLREQKRRYKKSRKKIEILYTKEEHEFLLLQSKKINASVAGYIKGSSLKKISLMIKEPKTDLETVAQIRKIGVNINQIAKAVNSEKNVIGSSQIYSEKLLENLNILHSYIDKILEK